jgi:putative iron-dependent peroxidase
MPDAWDRVTIEPQSVLAPLSNSAVFLTLAITPGDDAIKNVRGVISDIGGLVRTVGFRDLNGRLRSDTRLFNSGHRNNVLRPIEFTS